MASFEHTLNHNGMQHHLGTVRVVTGNFTVLDGLTGSGGTINTGLRRIFHFAGTCQNSTGATGNTSLIGIRLQNGAAVPPMETGDVFIVVPASNGCKGSFFAIGD